MTISSEEPLFNGDKTTSDHEEDSSINEESFSELFHRVDGVIKTCPDSRLTTSQDDGDVDSDDNVDNNGDVNDEENMDNNNLFNGSTLLVAPKYNWSSTHPKLDPNEAVKEDQNTRLKNEVMHFIAQARDVLTMDITADAPLPKKKKRKTTNTEDDEVPEKTVTELQWGFIQGWAIQFEAVIKSDGWLREARFMQRKRERETE